MSEDVQNDPKADTFKILVATDNHLGYMEKDGLRGNDSFITFEEILQIGVKEKVDFFLLGGDLFHENKPSVNTIHKCMELLRKYTLGDKPVEFQFQSDPVTNFGHNRLFPWVNYEDSNLNVAYPVFSIHGNHDDPMGPDAVCALDIFSASGLVNLFGKYTSVQKIEISPILLKKGSTRLALYGLGAVRDERLHRMFVHNQVSMLRPREDKEKWFSLFTVHQNRAKHGATNYLPEQFLDDFLDLVIWGHEHDCRIDAEWNNQQSFYVSQPGSSVATSLSEGEAGEKHVGILEIRGLEFKMNKVRLKTVRPFLMDDLILEDVDHLRPSDPKIEKKVLQFCHAKVEQLMERANCDITGHPLQPKEPLIRMRIDYSGGFDTFNVQQFGQSFVELVANPKDLIQFHRRRERAKRDSLGLGPGGHLKMGGLDLDDANGGRISNSALDSTRVEDLVRQFFSKGDERLRMNLLTQKELGLAVQTFVEKDAKDAIARVVDVQVNRARKHLESKGVRQEDDILEEIIKLKEMKEVMDEDGGSDVGDSEILRALREAEATASTGGADSNDEASPEADQSSRGGKRGGRRGRGASRGSTRGRGGRGRRAAIEEEEEDEIDEPISPPATKRASAPRGRGRGRGARSAKSTLTLEKAFKNSRASQMSSAASSRLQMSADEDDPIIVDDEDYEDSFSVTSRRAAPSSRKRARRNSDSDDDLDFAAIRRRKR